jgi:hypothetical protein
MNVISDLGSELAVAMLVEKKYERKVALRDALRVIDQVQTSLRRIPYRSIDERLELPVRPPENVSEN